ncbi:hypothetical protein H4R18_005131 [Coemansia javaensis]|uniref:Nudix hydrolase domain-containing protein n=1 Tax=Coemansia javaensis TaxID=2761396 RepID=A0A9W8LET5_9FUNG|nr:hypothetical protein H4R18_005131 [Coemansia javaensis]
MYSSILDVVRQCNCVGDLDALVEAEGMYRFRIKGRLVGVVSASDARALQAASDSQARPPFAFDHERRELAFSGWCDSREQRSAAVAELLAQMRAAGAWASLAKWRDELFMVYGDPAERDGVLLAVERAACYGFGILQLAAHVNGITRSESGQVRMWIARRSPKNQTWPGYLDLVAAGGITNGAGVRESMLRECHEEASVPAEIARTAKYAGTVQYFTRSALGLQPETLFAFDLELPAGFVPRPNDGEVDSFHLWPLDEVVDRIRRGEFKPDCAMCIVDFLVRHGYLTAENEPDYPDIVSNLHAPLPFPPVQLVAGDANTPAQLQRQLYLLGYSQALPEGGAALVGTLLRDMQAALDRVKELEESSTRLEREERTSRAGCERLRGELHALRTDNNRMRAEVLGYTRELDGMRRAARDEAYAAAKAVDDVRMENLRLKAEAAEGRRRLGECRARLEERVAARDPAGRIPRIAVNRPVPPAAALRQALHRPEQPPAIVDLVDLSSRRITALEEEIEQLEAQLRTATSELSAARLEVRERDLEIQRLNADSDERAGASAGAATAGADPVARLNDQVDYLHERAEALERECQEQRVQFQREKDELHRRWVQTENERVRLAERASAEPPPPPPPPPPQQQQPGSPPSSVSSMPLPATEAERLRAECANIKSLYAQTRDQLQELLKASSSTEAALRKELADARQSSAETIARLERRVAELQTAADGATANRELAQSRTEQVARLEERLSAAEDARAQEAGRLGAQLAAAQQDAAAHKQRYSAAHDEHQQLVAQHQRLSQSLKQAVADVAEWRAKADKHAHRAGDLARRLDEFRMLHTQDQTELRAARRTLDKFTSDLASLRDAHEAAQRDAARLRDELAQMTRLRQAVEMSKDDYKRQLVKALDEGEAHRALVAQLQAERRGLRVQVRAQLHLSQRLEQRLEALDPGYADEPLSADIPLPAALSSSSSLSSSPPPPPRIPRPASRSSSAAHSARSFDGGPRYASIRARLAASDPEPPGLA